MHISFSSEQFKLPPEYLKVQSIGSEDSKRKYKKKKIDKQVYLKFTDSRIEFSSCPNEQYCDLNPMFHIELEKIIGSSIKEAKDSKKILGIIEEDKTTTAIRFQKEDDTYKAQNEIEKYQQKSDKIMKIGKEKSYLKLQENTQKIRKNLLLQKDEKRWLIEEIEKRTSNAEIINYEKKKQLLFQAMFDDQPEVVKIKMKQKIQNYDILYAKTNLLREQQKDEIFANVRKRKNNVRTEGYSIKKQLEGIIPEDDIMEPNDPKLKEKKQQEQLFLNSLQDVNFDEDNVQKLMFEMDIQEKQPLPTQKKRKMCQKMKIPKKQYSLIQRREIQFVDQHKTTYNKGEDRKQKDKEELQLSKKVIEVGKVFYRLCQMKFNKRQDVDIYIDELRKIMTDLQKRIPETMHLKDFTKKMKQNYLQQIRS